MEDFLKSTSVLISLPTLLYVGAAHRRNRLELLKDLQGAMSTQLENFLTIPYEFLSIFICVGYGLAYHFAKGSEDEDGERSDSLGKALLVGAITGLLFSLTGRFGMDLPVKMFRFPRERAHMVHIVAPPVYVAIFVYVFFLMNFS